MPRAPQQPGRPGAVAPRDFLWWPGRCWIWARGNVCEITSSEALLGGVLAPHMHSKANPGPSKPEGRGTPRLGSHAGPVCPGPHAAACDAVTDTPLPRLQLPPPQNEAAGAWPVGAVGQRWWPGRPCRAAEARGPTRLSVPTHGGVWHVGVSSRRDGMVRRELVHLWQWGSPSVPPCPPAKGLARTRAYPSPLHSRRQPARPVTPPPPWSSAAGRGLCCSGAPGVAQETASQGPSSGLIRTDPCAR